MQACEAYLSKSLTFEQQQALLEVNCQLDIAALEQQSELVFLGCFELETFDILLDMKDEHGCHQLIQVRVYPVHCMSRPLRICTVTLDRVTQTHGGLHPATSQCSDNTLDSAVC